MNREEVIEALEDMIYYGDSFVVNMKACEEAIRLIKGDNKKTSMNSLEGYESPVKVYQSELQTAIEDETLHVAQHIGIDIDKEELLRALAYDRDQYKEGYEAGYKRAINDITESSCFTMRNPTPEELELIKKYWK